MTEQELLVDCLQRLNRLAVDYFLAGSMASNYWGIPRTTHDLDFVLQFPPSEVPRVVAAFEGGYLRRWAAGLNVTELLEDILAGRVRPKTT